MATITVNGNAVEIFSTDQVKEMCASNDTQTRRAVVDHLKLLGHQVTEIVRMKPEEREKAILAKYEEHGGKKAGKAAPTAGKTAAKAAPAAAAGKTANKAAAKKEEPAEEPEEEAANIESEPVDLSPVLEKLEGLEAQVEGLKEIATGALKFAMDAQFMVRAMLALNGQLDDAKELSAEHGTLFIEDDSEGN